MRAQIACAGKKFCFHLGATPLACLRSGRLDKALRLLQNASNPWNITDAALKAGFVRLGRFSATDRRHFVECPNQTRGRTPGLQPYRAEPRSKTDSVLSRTGAMLTAHDDSLAGFLAVCTGMGGTPHAQARLWPLWVSSGMASPAVTPASIHVAPQTTVRRPILLAFLWLLEAGLLLLDLFTGDNLTLLVYFILPGLVAAIFAPPAHVALLCLAALSSGVVAGWYFGNLLTTPYLVRFGAVLLLGGAAIILARGRERQMAETVLERNRVRATLDSLLDPHVVLRAMRDAAGQITDFIFVDANEAACQYNRLLRPQLLGRRLMEMLPAHAATGLLDMYRHVIETGRPLALDDFLYPHEILGEQRYFDIRAVGFGDELSYTWRDVTARHQAAETLARQARTDDLTKLLNRRGVFERLEALNGGTPRTGHGLAVLFVDFDKFKAINDVHGHAAGDEVLRVAADRIRACLRHEDDLGARVGGDELIVVLHGVHGMGDAATVAEKLRRSAAIPVRFDGKSIEATVSIGVALAHEGESTSDLVDRADQAMYRAKQQGRNQVITIDGGPRK